MDEKAAFDAQQEAKRDVAGRSDRGVSHDQAIRIYLAGLAYTVSHPAVPEARPQPTQAPAPAPPAPTPRQKKGA